MVQKVKNSMGLVNIPNELLEQVSKERWNVNVVRRRKLWRC